MFAVDAIINDENRVSRGSGRAEVHAAVGNGSIEGNYGRERVFGQTSPFIFMDSRGLAPYGPCVRRVYREIVNTGRELVATSTHGKKEKGEKNQGKT